MATNVLWALGILVAGLSVMFSQAVDAVTQNRIIDLFQKIVVFVVGGGAGAALGWLAGLRTGIRRSRQPGDTIKVSDL